MNTTDNLADALRACVAREGDYLALADEALNDYDKDTKRSLGDLLVAWSVCPPGTWENDNGPSGWWAVVSDNAGGIVAYFADEASAMRFRLAEINRTLNG